MTKKDIPVIIALAVCAVCFVGYPTDNGMIGGYFWKLCVQLANHFNL